MPKYFKREIADLNGTGERQYRYEMRSEGAVGTEYLAEEMHRHYRGLGKGELMGLIEGLVETIADTLADGYTVTLDGMGSFSLRLGLDDYSINTPQAYQTGEPNARRIEVTDVKFKAQRRYIQRIDGLCSRRLHRDHDGLSELRRPQTTPEERVQLALQHIRKHGFMRLMDYVQLTGLSRTTASKELTAFCKDSTVPITSQGLRSHKVYVEEKD
jgi:predicted histone-like DNA-binding protein